MTLALSSAFHYYQTRADVGGLRSTIHIFNVTAFMFGALSIRCGRILNACYNPEPDDLSVETSRVVSDCLYVLCLYIPVTIRSTSPHIAQSRYHLHYWRWYSWCPFCLSIGGKSIMYYLILLANYSSLYRLLTMFLTLTIEGYAHLSTTLSSVIFIFFIDIVFIPFLYLCLWGNLCVNFRRVFNIAERTCWPVIMNISPTYALLSLYIYMCLL